MTIYSGIFNSINGDRKYNAWWYALYFSTFIGDGVFPNPSTNLQVIEKENMNVIVKPGSGWIKGYFLHSDTDHTLKFDVADGVLKRIDRVVIAIKKGAYASSPVAPTLQRDTDAYELALADVLINNGATVITQANITDTRLNNNLCGIVHGTVNQVDTTTLFNQYQSWINQQKAIYEADVAEWTAEQISEFEAWQSLQESDLEAWKYGVEDSFNTWMQQEQSDFVAWYQSLQNLLDDNIAATLTAKVTTLEQEMGDVQSALNDKANSTDLTNHIDNETNPHNVTAEQTGAYHSGNLEILKLALVEAKKVRSNKDSNGKYLTLSYYRQDGTLLMESVLSADYLVRIENWYGTDGVTVSASKSFDIVLDADGDWVSEIEVST